MTYRNYSVVIATCGRAKLLDRALQSIARQTKKPDRVVVIHDSPNPNLQTLTQWGQHHGLNIETLANRRTKGSSGAWNSGLDHLLRSGIDPHDHLVSFLDDDDWWDPEYCRLIHSVAIKGFDVLAGSLSRHDQEFPNGKQIDPPSSLVADDFFIGNPGIQGSNLSARLSYLLMAGLFDEALPSCTDRDICIRLADLEPAYRAAPNAIAHHDTLHGLPRASDRASMVKKRGLDNFLAKWRLRMTDKQFENFADRAKKFFDWELPVQKKPENVTHPSTFPESPSANPLELVVGIIVDGSAPARCHPLLDNLGEISRHPRVRSLDVVLLENGDPNGFKTVIEHGRDIGLNTWAVELGDQCKAASDLSLDLAAVTRSKSIAVSRTLLQQFAYAVSIARNSAPVWILDDDFRVDGDIDQLILAVISCRDSGIDVALGGNSGAAPVPASSLLRTQLVDICHFFQWASNRAPDERVPDADQFNSHWLAEERKDYHYDLTRDATDRLETPFLPHFQGSMLQQATSEIFGRSERILAGEAISRPVQPAPICDPAQARDSLMRGGNTLIMNPALLHDIPNMSPCINGRFTRRSDMIWAANAKYRFGATIKSVRLPMIHDRATERAESDDTTRLVDDILGYGFFRAYDEALRQKDCPVTGPFSNEDERCLERNIHKYVRERLAAYRLSFWRCVGLTRILRKFVADSPWWLVQSNPGDRGAFIRFLDLLQKNTDLEHLKRVETGVESGLASDGFATFMAGMKFIHRDRMEPAVPGIRDWLKLGRAARAKKMLQKHLNLEAQIVLGMGHEGVVLRLGDQAFKIFDRWTASERKTATPIMAALRDHPTNGAIPEVLAIHDWPEFFAVEYRFEDSDRYEGGKGPLMVRMLRDLLKQGWTHTNINPKNMRITARGLQLIDIGKSLAPSSTKGIELMVRRAFLSWRFAGRTNLATVMHKSVETEFLPELTGWRVLLEAVTAEPSKCRLDSHILDRIDATLARSILDYGCGKPRTSKNLAQTHDLTVFEIDPTLRGRWRRDVPEAQFWNKQQLDDALKSGKQFDLIVCSLVLCATDDAKMLEILNNIRRLVQQDGQALVAVCDPAAVHVSDTVDHRRHDTISLDSLLPACYRKSVGESSVAREEFHRSIDAYRRAFARSNLSILGETTIGGFDSQRFERVPEFIVFELGPLPALSIKTSLLIKLCALESETALYQVRHLERQLNRPRAFDEIVLLIDPREGSFPRAHSLGNLGRLRQAADRLVAEGTVDRVVEGLSDGSEAAAAAHRWTGFAAHRAHCANGQPATSILAAFEKCVGDFVLHVDADVMIGRPDPNFDHIADTVRVFQENPNAVTLALSVNGDTNPISRFSKGDFRPFRTEAMAGWIARSRLFAFRPLPGGGQNGRLNLPWHRMLDIAIKRDGGQSLRRGSRALWFVAPDNGRKSAVDDHLLLLDRVESNYSPAYQSGHPLVQGPLVDWIGPKRTESLVVVICGRNVGPGRIDRCMVSLLEQSHSEWGAVVIDDGSDNGSFDALKKCCRRLGGRVTLIRRRRRVGLLANTYLAVRHLIASPDAIVVLLDLDDALARPDALDIVTKNHRNGVDLTVGSMLRTDKEVVYPVEFVNPRGNRGGNVWQHLRAFRKSLFDRIAPKDLQIDGHWVDLANDWAFMLPIAEMAKNPLWIREVLYLHEPSTSRPDQEKAAREAVIAQIVAKPSYHRRPLHPPIVTTLCYHRVLENIPEKGPDVLFHRRGMAVSASTMVSQIRAALKSFEPIRLSDFLAAQRGELALPENAILVTVDDGYRDFATIALPLMKQLGIEPVLFTRTPTPDGFPSWAPLDLLYVGRGLAGMDTPLPSMNWRALLLKQPYHTQVREVGLQIDGMIDTKLAAARRGLYLSEDELRSLRGCVLGAHGEEHVRWTNLSDQQLQDMFYRSFTWLTNVNGLPVAAYPDGKLDSRVASLLASAGFQAGFGLSSLPEITDPSFSIRRVVMPDDPGFVPVLANDRLEDEARA